MPFIMKLLGINTDKNMVSLIVYNMETSENSEILKLIEKTLIE